MCRYRRACRLPLRADGVLAAAAALAAGASAIASTPAMAGRQAGPQGPGVQRVAAGPARSLGEPAAAQDGAVTAVTATSFGTAGARAKVWTRRAGAAAWRTGAVLPAGFGSSYDPSAVSAPGRAAARGGGHRAARPGVHHQRLRGDRERGPRRCAERRPAGERPARDGQLRRPADRRGRDSTAWSGWPGRRDRTRTPARTSVTATGSRSPSPGTEAGRSATRSPCQATAATPRSACGSRRCAAVRWRSPGPRPPRQAARRSSSRSLARARARGRRPWR